MGLFGNTMGIMGDIARGTASASMWTGIGEDTPLDSNFDTKLESSFLFILADSAPKTAYQTAYLQFEHESHPLLQNATSSSYRPDVAFPIFWAVI